MKNLWFASLLLVGVAASASAQQPADQQATAAAPSAAASPLIVEKIEDGWLIAPDARWADLDGRTGALIGGYGGYVVDNTLLVGAGGYWMANGDWSHELGYGGAVVEWMALKDRRIGFGVRSLVGVGVATMPLTYIINSGNNGPGGTRGMMPQNIRFGRNPGNVPGLTTRPVTAAVQDDFFVFEPQLNLLLNLAKHYRVSAGVGYRVIAGAGQMDRQLEGLSGAVSLRIFGH